IIEWLNDKSSALFERQEAPVLGMSGVLDKDETIFILSGLIPNRKSHPMINEWFGVIFKNNEFKEIISMDELLKKVKLNEKEYSNIDRIIDFNADCVKVDRCITSQLEDGIRARVILKHIFNLSKELNIGVVVEGVENQSQLDMLKEYGYKLIQGFYLSEPVELDYLKNKVMTI
ncbi:EAL domain-containing protein, partial [Clostridium saudiense]|nr:EAL domain-containing protein [Clostridium saudiense]